MFNVAMTSKDKNKVESFIEYAEMTEGMIYKLRKNPNNSFSAVTTIDYDPQVVDALKRMFNEDWSYYT